MPSISIRPTRSIMPVMLHGAASTAICSVFLGVPWVTNQPIHQSTWTLALAACVLQFLLGELIGIYRPSRDRTADLEVGLITVCWVVVFLTLLVLGIVTRITESVAWQTIWLWFLVGGLAILCLHMSIRAGYEIFWSRGVGARRTAIVGLNRLGIEIAENARKAADCGLDIIGFFDDRAVDRRENAGQSQPPLLGKTNDLLDMVQAGQVDTVLITLSMKAELRIQALLDKLSNSTVSVYIVPDFLVFELLHSRWTQVGGLPVVSVFESPIYGVDGIIKRFLDLAISLIGIVLVAPVLIVCAILVRFSSPGPIFFRQKRYGLDGREILVWKFRTMYTCDNGPIVVQATKNDPRITPIGSLLRRTSLDEVPQLINVIGGSMSLVGPRPHANAHNEHFRKLIRGYMMRHKVKPGITGLAQVEGSRGETDTIEKMEDRLALDHRYIRDWSMWLDLKIIFKTFFVVLRQDAY